MCHLLVLLEANHVLHVSRIRVKWKYVSSGQRTLESVEGVSRLRERCGCGSASNSDKLIKI